MIYKRGVTATSTAVTWP